MRTKAAELFSSMSVLNVDKHFTLIASNDSAVCFSIKEESDIIDMVNEVIDRIKEKSRFYKRNEFVEVVLDTVYDNLDEMRVTNSEILSFVIASCIEFDLYNELDDIYKNLEDISVSLEKLAYHAMLAPNATPSALQNTVKRMQEIKKSFNDCMYDTFTKAALTGVVLEYAQDGFADTYFPDFNKIETGYVDTDKYNEQLAAYCFENSRSEDAYVFQQKMNRKHEWRMIPHIQIGLLNAIDKGNLRFIDNVKKNKYTRLPVILNDTISLATAYAMQKGKINLATKIAENDDNMLNAILAFAPGEALSEYIKIHPKDNDDKEKNNLLQEAIKPANQEITYILNENWETAHNDMIVKVLNTYGSLQNMINKTSFIDDKSYLVKHYKHLLYINNNLELYMNGFEIGELYLKQASDRETSL